jgi:hypothetical protein
MTGTALVKSNNGSAAFVSKFSTPEMRQMEEYAFVFLQSQMFEDVKSITQAMVKIKAGQEMGFQPFTSIAGFHLIKGKVIPGASLIGAKIKSSGAYDYDINELTNQKCVVQFFRKNAAGDLTPMGIPIEYTYEQAQTAGLTSNQTWSKHPQDMLFATCLRKGGRRYCPELLAGLGADTGEHDNAVIDEVKTEQEAPQNFDVSVEAETIDDADIEAIATEDDEERGELLANLSAGIDALMSMKERKEFLSTFGVVGEDLANASIDQLRDMQTELNALANKQAVAA